MQPDRRDSVDYRARQLERSLSLRMQQQGRWAGKPAAVHHEVGDSRLFRFTGDGRVPPQSFRATVAAVNDLVVAWIQDDLREDDDNIDEGRMQAIIDQFAEDYPLVVETFGAPSDVDGDGRVAVLVTHLMQDVGAGGQFRASSLVPRRAGGDGNVTDLLWTNPLVPEESYRSLLAHEFQHLINFNQHVLVRQGLSEAPWLNEGLSHLAEDLVQEPPNDNYRLVRTFLSEPGAVGLSRDMLTLATRGAAYLFVRSLVDLLGEGVLLRLVQTDRVERGNVEAATGESFADLMARWGAQLYVSGTGRSSHPRLNYRVPSLRPPEGRGFPLPVPVTWRWGEEPPGLAVRPWGLQFLRVTGGGRGTLVLQTEPGARLGAVPVPAARADAAATMPPDHFAGLTLDAPPPLELATGEPLLFEGTTADSVETIHLEFVPEEGGEPQTFFLLVDRGRFSRTVFFRHDEAGNYSLNVYVVQRRPTPFTGSFHPVRLTQGHGPLLAPTRYFNRVRLDRPLPTSVHAGQTLRIRGEVSDPEATVMELELYPLDEDDERGATADTTLSLPVRAGRFDGLLSFAVPVGRYWLAMDLGPAGDLTYVGAVPIFEVLPPAPTAVEPAAAEPHAFALHPNYPNPFNSRTHLSFSLPEDQPSVELAVYDLLGQKLAVLAAGPRESGLHSVEWDGRDDAGRPLASGPLSLPPAGGAAPRGGQAAAAALGEAKVRLIPMALVLLSPLLVKADTVPRTFFPGIVLDHMPASFETGQTLSLSGTAVDSSIIHLRFLFSRADGVEMEFWAWVVGNRFVREAVFPHSLDGEFSLLVEARKEEGPPSPLGRFDGLQIGRGEGPVLLPRLYFPLVHLDEPMPTRLATGAPLHLAGHLELPPPAMLLFRFVTDAGNRDFHILAQEQRFERTLLLPREVEGSRGLIAYLGVPGGQLTAIAWYFFLDVEAGDEPAEVPRHFFNGLVLDEPLPVKWPLHRPVVVAGEVRPWVRAARLILAPREGERRLLSFGLEEGRFRFPVRLTGDERGPVRLGLQIELEDETNWIAGSIDIEGVDVPLPDLEVGVLAVSLLAGQQTRVPLRNRGRGAVTLEAPRVEGPFPVEAYPEVSGTGRVRGGRVELQRPGGRPGSADRGQRRSLPAPGVRRPFGAGAPGGVIRPGAPAGRFRGPSRGRPRSPGPGRGSRPLRVAPGRAVSAGAL